MYFSGFTQGLMWKEFTADGMLRYPNFLETTLQILPMHMLRAFGGLLYLTGTIIMTWNLFKTAKSGSLLTDEEAEAFPLVAEEAGTVSHAYWHRWIERRPTQLIVLSLVAVAIGGVVEFVPSFLVESNVQTITSVTPYSPLELEGRDIYIREGCNNCHSQQVRPFRSETVRYGEYSKSGENVYDHPFLWGSKRTGPDLARAGNTASKVYKDAEWHYRHMKDPRSTSPGSIMPAYPWLIEEDGDYSDLAGKIAAMRTLGVPYEEGYETIAMQDLEKQAKQIQKFLLTEKGIKVGENKEIVALIAYLHKLGRDINTKDVTALTK
jgi:cytochrome c oxidase cbb3-type subunit I/II